VRWPWKKRGAYSLSHARNPLTRGIRRRRKSAAGKKLNVGEPNHLQTEGGDRAAGATRHKKESEKEKRVARQKKSPLPQKREECSPRKNTEPFSLPPETPGSRKKSGDITEKKKG